MPTRRILEMAVAVDLLLVPVKGMARVWAHYTLGTAQPGTIRFGIAEIVAVIT